MDKTTKLKEALKFALAFALVYGIALKVNWMSPGWAGWSVVAISATSGGGESLQKGFLRIWGTLLACLIGIAIISIGAQNRWVFMFLTATWLFFCTYLMLSDKKRSYFWFVAGYVALVITAAGPSSAGGFYIAVFRTIETIMGIVVYTLIAVFIWPRSNIGAIKKALSNLLETQIYMFQEIAVIFGGTHHKDRLKVRVQQQVKLLDQFSQSLKAEGSESYEVKELKPLWDRFERLNETLIKSLDRLFGGIEDLSKVDLKLNRPDVDRFFKEMINRFRAMSMLPSGDSSPPKLQDVKLKVKSFERQDISHFDKAALAIIIAELNIMESISRKMMGIALKLSGSDDSNQKSEVEDIELKKKSIFNFPVVDIEFLQGSFYVFSVIVIGFIIWFYVNPPGHASWYIMSGVFALIFAGAQQVKTIKLIVPFFIAMFLGSLVYLFVLPELTMFYQLGILLFICIFVIQYYLPGAASAIFTIALIQLVAIDNPQSYNISGLINGFVFVFMLMIFLYFMSYLISSPRPEKAHVRLVSRFFKSAKYLVSQEVVAKGSLTFFQGFKLAFYLYELHSLPPKINTWGKAINTSLFPNTNTGQIEEMVNAMEVFAIRMETLIEAKYQSNEDLPSALDETINNWRGRLLKAFDCWDHLKEEEVLTNTTEFVLKRMEELEEKLKTIVAQNEESIDPEEGIKFYQLLGGYRGVTEATLSYGRIADKIDWKQWKEERFQ